jgi:CelD/BcsL family acetyltransferase involved in cellulose biosynthesis
VEISVLEKIPEDPEIVLAWNRLAFQMDRPEVFFTHQWALAVSRAFSESLAPLTVLAYESGRLVGVAAMATNRGARDAVVFLTASTADYCDVVSQPEARGAVLTAVLAALDSRGVRNVTLANVPADSQTLTAIQRAASSRRFHLHRRHGYDCGIISLDNQEHRQAVLQMVERKGREKRALKRLGQLGSVGIVHLIGEQAEIALQLIVSAQISRFLATNRVSPLVQQSRRMFLEELGRLLSPTGWLKVSQLEVNGKPIAWNYGFRFLDSWFWYLPTFQVQYEELSPGSCLLRLLIEESCADSSVRRLDLGLGDEAYKQRFSNAISPTCYLQLSKSPLRHVKNTGREWLAASVGRFPAVDKRVRHGRSLLQGLQSRLRNAGLAATAKHAVTRIKKSAVSEDEIAFFEAPQISASEEPIVSLGELGWENLAVAAMENANDEPTLAYLMRCAERLKKTSAPGYFLRGHEARSLHLLWVADYNGFHLSEIDFTLESKDPTAAMLFDCWTPTAQRGHGYYATAIRLAAGLLQQQQRKVWIFSAATNKSSLGGILHAGFTYRFSLLRSRRFGHSTLSRRVSMSGQPEAR